MVADEDEMFKVPQKSKAETVQRKRFESCYVQLQCCPTTPKEICETLKKRKGEEISNDDAIKTKKQKTCIDDNG